MSWSSRDERTIAASWTTSAPKPPIRRAVGSADSLSQIVKKSPFAATLSFPAKGPIYDALVPFHRITRHRRRRDHRLPVRHHSPLHANCYALAPRHGRFLIVLGVIDNIRCDMVPRQSACGWREHDIVPCYRVDPLPFASLLHGRTAPLWLPGITASVANAREKCRRQPPSTLLVPFILISSLLHDTM